MGNSQSSIDKIESAVDKGLRIYKLFKEYQNNQEEIHVEDGPEDYHRLRALAGEEAQKRNQFYERSQAAYQAGDGAEGMYASYYTRNDPFADVDDHVISQGTLCTGSQA